MPEIPMYVQRQVVEATPVAPYQSIAEAGALGDQLTKAGKVAEAFQQEKDVRAATDAKLKFHTFAADFNEKIAKDPNYDTYGDRFKEAFAQWKGQNLDSMTSGARLHLGASIDEAYAQHAIQVQKQARLQQVDQSKADLMMNLDDARKAYGRGDGSNMEAVVGDGLRAINERLATGALTHVEAEAQREHFQDAIADERARMLYSRDPKAFARSLRDGGHEWLGGKQRLAWQEKAEHRADMLDARAEAERYRLERAAEALQAAKEKTVDDGLRAIKRNAEAGYPTDADGLTWLREKARGTGREDLVAAVDGEVELQKSTAAFSALPPLQQKAIVDREVQNLKANGADIGGNRASYVARLSRIAEGSQKAADDDPLTFAARGGIVSLSPVKLDDQGSLMARMEAGRAVQSHLGLTYTPILTKNEADSFTQQLQSIPDPRQKVAALTGMMSAAGDDATASQMIGMMERSGLPSEYRTVATIAKTDPGKAAKILSELAVEKKGIKLAEGDAKTVKADTQDRFQSKFGEVWDKAYALTGNGAYIQAKDSAYAIAERLALVRKAGGQDIDGAPADAVAGQPFSRTNLAHVILPADAKPQDAAVGFDALRKAPALLDAYRKSLEADPTYNARDPADVRRKERLVQALAETGTWVPSGSGVALLTPSGRPVSVNGKPYTIPMEDVLSTGARARMLRPDTIPDAGRAPAELMLSKGAFGKPVGGVTGSEP